MVGFNLYCRGREEEIGVVDIERAICYTKQMRIVIIIVSLTLLLAGSAQGADLPDPYQEWNESVTRVPLPKPGLEVVISETPCSGDILGCAYAELNRIEVSPQSWKSTFLHEEGHIFDAEYMTETTRTQFLSIIHHSNFEWWGIDYDHSGGEWFADSYMQCARLPRIDPSWEYSVGSGAVKGRLIKRVCSLIRHDYAANSM